MSVEDTEVVETPTEATATAEETVENTNTEGGDLGAGEEAPATE